MKFTVFFSTPDHGDSRGIVKLDIIIEVGLCGSEENSENILVKMLRKLKYLVRAHLVLS